MTTQTTIEPMGFFRKFFHNTLGWHTPSYNPTWLHDGCSLHAKCKYCGMEIMQDSQGNWFLGGTIYDRI